MLATNNASTSLQPMTARSLVISPNLDALLEHEERVRGSSIQIPSRNCSQVLSSPVSPGNYISGVSASVGRGLPPPPRGNRRPKSPRSPRPAANGHGTESSGCTIPTCQMDTDKIIQGQQQQEQQPEKIAQQPEKEGLPSSKTNPYINPAPTLDELGHEKEREGRPSSRRTASQRSQSRTVSLLVDKRFNSCRTIVDLFSDNLPRATALHKNLAHTHPRRPNKLRKTTGQCPTFLWVARINFGVPQGP